MKAKINKLRLEIDLIDQQIIQLIAGRVEVARKIGEIKKTYNLPIIDLIREAEAESLRLAACNDNKLDPELVKKVFEQLIVLSKKVQE